MNKLFFLWVLMTFVACNSEFVPKPRGYYKIDFPERAYQVFEKAGFPYSFEYPVYSHVVQDTTFFEDRPENPYWINIEFPQFKGTIYISYKEVKGGNYSKLVDDAFKMTYKHSYKASSIEDSVFVNDYNVGGVFFNVGGNAATAKQFFLTDTTKHFLRGALYFDTAPNEDSLRVVNNFLVQDLNHLLATFKWKGK